MSQKVRYRLVRIHPDGRRGVVLERAKRETIESWVPVLKRSYPGDGLEIEEFIKQEKERKG